MDKTLLKSLDKLKAFDNERRTWLILSAFVIATILGIVFEWRDIVEYKLIWAIMSAGFTICAVWWYWTMRLIRFMIETKNQEYQLLSDVIDLVKTIKQDVKILRDGVDK